MLSSLHIKDFAIIDELTVSFGPGLNIMTGETGAGKTIIVEALNLVLGTRAQTDLIRAGSDRASVTAVFDMSRVSLDIKNEIERAGVDCAGELIIHRVVGAGGKGRISINGVPVTGASLKTIAERLIDVASQHEHQLLLEQSEHTRVLDSFGGADELLQEYLKSHQEYMSIFDDVSSLEANERDAQEKLDFLKFQLQEIESARMKPGEDAELEAERSRLKHAVQLEEKTRSAEATLYKDSGSAIELLDAAAKLLAECERFDPQTSKWSEGIGRARAEVEEVSRDLSHYADRLESDPERLEAIDERLHLLRRLAKKHGGSIETCLDRAKDLSSEVLMIANYDDILADKREKLKISAARRGEAAMRLTKARKEASIRLARAVVKGLCDLGMSKTEFSILVEPKPEMEWDENGPDLVEFLISPNVGEPLKPLARIASGGELSRVMLAIKGALADGARLAGTSVFDEVDSGIGGAVAEVVGKKLRDVSRSRQIICITHLPQVAVYGDHHIRISKQVKMGRTVTTLEDLSSEVRADEIARMLGGRKITDATVIHANEMLEHARRAGVSDKG